MGRYSSWASAVLQCCPYLGIAFDTQGGLQAQHSLDSATGVGGSSRGTRWLYSEKASRTYERAARSTWH